MLLIRGVIVVLSGGHLVRLRRAKAMRHQMLVLQERWIAVHAPFLAESDVTRLHAFSREKARAFF